MPQYYYKRYSMVHTDTMAEALRDAMAMSPAHLILCVHDKTQLVQATAVIDVLPSDLVRDLRSHNRGTYQGTDVYLLTDKIAPSCPAGGIAIAPFVDLKLMPKIHRSNPDAIIYLPWMESELPVFQALLNATQL